MRAALDTTTAPAFELQTAVVRLARPHSVVTHNARAILYREAQLGPPERSGLSRPKTTGYHVLSSYRLLCLLCCAILFRLRNQPIQPLECDCFVTIPLSVKDFVTVVGTIARAKGKIVCKLVVYW